MRTKFDSLGFYLPVKSFVSFPPGKNSGVQERRVFRRFYACFSGPTGNLVELNNSARPINVTTHGRRCLAGFVREDLEVDGGTPGKLNVLFHRNVPEGLHIPTSQKSGPSRGYTPLVLCGLSRFHKLLPTISLRFLRQS